MSWMMSGVLEIDANTLEEACDMAYEPEIGLPEDGYYIEESFEVDDFDLESVRHWYNNDQEDEPDDDV